MPYPSWDPRLGRMVHPWEKQFGDLDRQRDEFQDELIRRLHRLYLGHPPRYWDEPYYTEDPESLLDRLEKEFKFKPNTEGENYD